MFSHDEILRRVEKTINRNLKNSAIAAPITYETTAQDVQGWDSLSHAVLMMAIEHEFSIELPLEETLEMTNVGDLVVMIKNQIR